MEIRLRKDVGDVTLHQQHSEVMHYTTALGLAGILESNILFATHTAFLNDNEEVAGFFDRALPKILAKTFDTFEPSASKRRGENWRQAVINALKVAETTGSENYVFSLSEPNSSFIAKNGLLSQWRGYGHDGGYAIVFDWNVLTERLIEEPKNYCDESLSWGNAEYHLDKIIPEATQQILEKISKLQSAVSAYLWQLPAGTADLTEAAERCFEHMTNLSTFYKHVGFSEESEVRVVLSVPGKAVGPDPDKTGKLPNRPIKYFLRNGVPVPCAHLFAGGIPLPIKRVIVGPHPDKHARLRAVEILLARNGVKANVDVSDIPYRGRGP